jgi:TetR/AcrR family transcriptional repressor of nem operon
MSSQSSETRPRGRPRRVAEEAALEAAMRVFWARGYAAASVEDLSRATGLNRSSLYHLWADKRGLFAATVAHYAETRLRPVAAALETGGTLAKSLRAFFSAVADLALAEDGGRGCLVSCALAEAAAGDAGFAEELARRFDAVEARLADRIARAAPGETPPGVDPSALAARLAAAARGMMLRARSGADRAALDRVGGAAVALLCDAAARPGA